MGDTKCLHQKRMLTQIDMEFHTTVETLNIKRALMDECKGMSRCAVVDP